MFLTTVLYTVLSVVCSKPGYFIFQVMLVRKMGIYIFAVCLLFSIFVFMYIHKYIYIYIFFNITLCIFYLCVITYICTTTVMTYHMLTEILRGWTVLKVIIALHFSVIVLGIQLYIYFLI